MLKDGKRHTGAEKLGVCLDMWYVDERKEGGGFEGGMGWNLSAYISISVEEGVGRESCKKRLFREAV